MADESFYEGTPYSLEPGYSSLSKNYGDLFIGYSSPLKSLSMATDPRTANQIQEVSTKLNPGGKAIEMSMVSPEIFEAIPDQHLTEINRLSKVVGAEISFHAGTIVEPSGITKQGYDEEFRKQAERQALQAVERGHKLNPDGNIPIVFHTTASIPGTEYGFDEVNGKRKEVEKRIPVINQETSELRLAKKEERMYPGMDKPKISTPRDEINTMNRSSWENRLTQVTFNADKGRDILKANFPLVAGEITEFVNGKVSQDQFMKEINSNPDKRAAYNQVQTAQVFLENTDLELNSLFNQVYKYGDSEQKKELEKLNKSYKEELKSFKRKEDYLEQVGRRFTMQQELLNGMRELAPAVYKPLEDFATEKVAKTFGNLAFESYKKFGKTAPMITIENPPSGTGLSRAEDVRNIIEKSRNNFVDQAVKKGISKQEAESASKKLITATWDLGHANMLKKYGFTDKDLIKETKTIAPYVKHVHLSDNFGFEHTELPMGMGNVPTKDMLEKLEKAGFDGKKVIEAAGWYQHFKTMPLVPTLEAFGSPIYPMKAAPTWNQVANTYGDYFSGYGPFLPEQHFSMYGGGFSGMPVELGGQMQGRGSRFSGTPNQ
jgi:sugar phosphate isomerase/epimerase